MYKDHAKNQAQGFGPCGGVEWQCWAGAIILDLQSTQNNGPYTPAIILSTLEVDHELRAKVHSLYSFQALAGALVLGLAVKRSRACLWFRGAGKHLKPRIQIFW